MFHRGAASAAPFSTASSEKTAVARMRDFMGICRGLSKFACADLAACASREVTSPSIKLVRVSHNRRLNATIRGTGPLDFSGGFAMRNLPTAAVAIHAALLFAVCLLTCADDARGDERDLAVEFKAAKANLTQQLRDRKKENRLAAVRKLETYPIPDSAKLLLFQGLSSTDED